MSRPPTFTWIEKPLLGALAYPDSPDEMEWLRGQGIQILLSLTEDPPRTDWVENAGLLEFHVPMVDMEPPGLEQIERCVSAITKAHERRMGVAVHCVAGLGRTGVVLASYFVIKGLTPANAINRIRRLRPGSIETVEQENVVEDFCRQQSRKNEA